MNKRLKKKILNYSLITSLTLCASVKGTFLNQAIGSCYDFASQCNTLVKGNISHEDSYHHALANSYSTQRGKTGKFCAVVLSNVKEFRDFYFKGWGLEGCIEDQLANEWGRQIPSNTNPEQYNSFLNHKKGGARINLNKIPPELYQPDHFILHPFDLDIKNIQDLPKYVK
jgi:hypothetical protein